MKQIKNNFLSHKLEKVAMEAFFEYVLPIISKKLPNLINKFMVNITSSVAYGMADKYSDLDLFIIFYKQTDYVKYSNIMNKIISEIKFPEHYYNICDKGIRFEIESLVRADIEKIFKEPSSKRTWYILSSWLMYWFINSITIYDPLGIVELFKKKYKFYPQKISISKIRSITIKILKNYFYLKKELQFHHRYFLIIYYTMKIINAIIDVNFLKKGIYSPHNKWKFVIFSNHFPASYHKLINDIFIIMKDMKKNNNFSKQLLKKIKKIIDFIIPTNIPFHKVFNQKVIIHRFVNNTKICLHTNYHVTKNDFAVSLQMLMNDYNVITAEESGIYYLINNKTFNYDTLMRISADLYYYNNFLKLRTIGHIYSKNFLKKKCKYYNFIIWRKIRIIEKGLKRRQHFMTYWYYIEVCLLFVEAYFYVYKKFLRPIVLWDNYSFLSIDPELNKLIKFFLNAKQLSNTNIRVFIDFAWHAYAKLQSMMLTNDMIDKASIDNPLSTQFDIEYWKYENLFQ